MNVHRGDAQVDKLRDMRFNCAQEARMGTPAQNFIASFDHLPDAEQREVASAILRRTLEIEFPSFSDDELVLSAEEIFLDLDRREAEDTQS